MLLDLPKIRIHLINNLKNKYQFFLLSNTNEIHINKLQNIDSENTYCVSLNLDSKINQEKIINEFEYEHPIFFPGIAEYQAQHKSLIRNNRISFCGAYWGYGFQEDGVNSALKVCESYDMGLV